MSPLIPSLSGEFFQFIRATHLNQVSNYHINNINDAHCDSYVLSGAYILNSIRIDNSVITVWYFTSDKHRTIQRKHTAHCNVGYLIEYIRKHCHTNNQLQSHHTTTSSHINLTNSNGSAMHKIIGTWCPDANNNHSNVSCNTSIPSIEYCTTDTIATMLSENTRQSSTYTGWLQLYNTPLQYTTAQTANKHTYIHAVLSYSAVRCNVDLYMYNAQINANNQCIQFNSTPIQSNTQHNINLSSVCNRIERHTRTIHDHCNILLQAQSSNKPIINSMAILFYINDVSDKLTIIGATQFQLLSPNQLSSTSSNTVSTSPLTNTATVAYPIGERLPCVHCSHLITTPQNERTIGMLDLLYIKIAMRYAHQQTSGELFFTLAKQYSTHISNSTQEQFKLELATNVIAEQQLRICVRCEKDLTAAVDRNGIVWKQIDQLRLKYLDLQSFNPDHSKSNIILHQPAVIVFTTAQPRSRTLEFSKSFANDPHLRNSVARDRQLDALKQTFNQTALHSWQARHEQLRQRQHARVARQARRQAEINGTYDLLYILIKPILTLWLCGSQLKLMPSDVENSGQLTRTTSGSKVLSKIYVSLVHLSKSRKAYSITHCSLTVH